MRKMYMIVVISLVASVLLMSGCHLSENTSAAKGKIEGSVTLPVGVWYSSDALEWEKGYLPDALCPLFFGEKMPDYPWVLYLGTDDDSFAELLYAVCHTEYEARALAEMLSARLSSVKKNAEGRYSESLTDASVERHGKSVLYTAVPDNEGVLRLFS